MVRGMGCWYGPSTCCPETCWGHYSTVEVCGDELAAPEEVGANKETSVKHLKENKGCCTEKVT